MTPVPVVEAVVQVGAQETPYLRCGRGGDCVIVVTTDAAERSRLLTLFDGYCVVAPLVEQSHPNWFDDAASLSHWLRGVIDGLGVQRPLVVVRPPAS